MPIEWRDGKKQGQGTYTYSDGTTHEGEWKDGEMLPKCSKQ